MHLRSNRGYENHNSFDKLKAISSSISCEHQPRASTKITMIIAYSFNFIGMARRDRFLSGRVLCHTKLLRQTAREICFDWHEYY